MKKLLIPFIAILVSGILLSSCNSLSKMSFTKRHYRSGYYVDFGRKRILPQVLVSKIPDVSKKQLTAWVPKSEKQVVTYYVKPDQQKANIPQKIVQQPEQHHPILLKNIPREVNQKIKVGENPALKTTSSLSNSTGYEGEHSERAALSLLWIVIVVILILWLIGILAGDFGIGGLINLLLVIALILLILWLLRIV